MRCKYCGKEMGTSTGAKGLLAMHIKHKHPEVWEGRKA